MVEVESGGDGSPVGYFGKTISYTILRRLRYWLFVQGVQCGRGEKSNNSGFASNIPKINMP
jgi:hypothetical protein